MKKGKKIIVLFLILIIIAIAGGVYAYIATDIFKTPDQLFKKYLVNNIEQVSNFNMNPLTDALERMENEKAEFYINASLDESVLNDDEDTDGVIDTCKVSVKTDFPNDGVNVDISLKQGDNELLNMSMAIAEDIFGIKIDELYDEYIAVENRDLQKLAKTLGVDEDSLEEVPDKIEKSTVEFSDEEKETIENLKESYLTKLFDAISKDKYSSEKNVDVTVGDETISTSKYTLAITDVELEKIIFQLSKELLDDQNFIALCENRIDDEKLEELRDDIDDEIKELDEIDEDDIENLKISVYASSGKVVKTEIATDKESYCFSVINKENESTIYISTNVLKNDNATVSLGATGSIILNNKIENDAGTCTLEIKQEYDKDDLNDLIATYEDESDDDDELGLNSIYDREYFEEKYADTSTKIILSSTVQEDEIAYQLSLESDNESITTINKALKVKFGFKFNNDIEITTLDSSNAEIINDYTEADFEKLTEEIQENLEKSIEENPNSIFAILFGNFNTLYSSDDEYYVYDEDEDDDEDNGYTANISSNITNSTISLNQDDEEEKEQVEEDITKGLNNCLSRYKMALAINSDANLGDYLTVEAVQEYCGDDYILGLLNGSTIKCEVENSGNVYYITMEINGDNFELTNVTVYTEDEYQY